MTGDATFTGDIRLNGRSMTDTLDRIEERLGILHPNTELEERWQELRELGDKYRALEKDIMSKEKVWDILKR